MAVLNIRVEDRIRDQLKELADAEGVSLSEYVRDLLMAVVVPVFEREVEPGDEARRSTGTCHAPPNPCASAARGRQRR